MTNRDLAAGGTGGRPTSDTRSLPRFWTATDRPRATGGHAEADCRPEM